MQKNHSFQKFLISFLTFYIILSLAARLGDGGWIHQWIQTIIIGNMPAANYIWNSEQEDSENSIEMRILSGILNTSPLFAYAQDQYDNSKDLSDPSIILMKDEEEEPEQPTQTETETEKQENKEDTKGEEGKTETSSEKNTEENAAVGNNIFSIPKVTGVKYSVDKLSDFDFLVNNFYTVSASTVVYKRDLDPKVLLGKDLHMKQDNSKPQILIYHTHSQEAFADSTKEGMTIVEVGDYLAEILSEQFGYQVIHLRDSFDMVNGVLDRHKAYDYAYNKISQVLADNPSIELVIDLHRDGVDDSLHFVTEINGKPTAKVMFFNGLSRLASIGEIDYLNNPYREDNLALSMQMKMNAEAYYPDFTRKNYLHAYEYNLSVRPKAMLIEAGAQTNTFQEELNAMEPLAVLLHMTAGN